MMRTGSGGSCQLTGTHGPTFDSRISCPIETSYFGRNWNSLPGCEPPDASATTAKPIPHH